MPSLIWALIFFLRERKAFWLPVFHRHFLPRDFNYSIMVTIILCVDPDYTKENIKIKKFEFYFPLKFIWNTLCVLSIQAIEILIVNHTQFTICRLTSLREENTEKAHTQIYLICFVTKFNCCSINLYIFFVFLFPSLYLSLFFTLSLFSFTLENFNTIFNWKIEIKKASNKSNQQLCVKI